ncbi:MAG: KH domain-containing protein [Thermoleophilia bacterium]
MDELIAYLARSLVDRPDDVSVGLEQREDAIVYRLRVAAEDRGKVIGKQGRIARSLRTVVRAGGIRSGQRMLLEIVE